MEVQPPTLAWAKSSRNTWCKFLELEPACVEGFGVYVIWHGGYPSRVVYVGHGAIARELAERRADAQVLACAEHGPLYVTWATADPSCAEGIARFLAGRLRPRVAGPASSGPLVAANSPF